jgi:hypothetical protein
VHRNNGIAIFLLRGIPGRVPNRIGATNSDVFQGGNNKPALMGRVQVLDPFQLVLFF